jgi:hypothetical protein
MELDVSALATQQDAIDLSQAVVLGRVTRDGRDMLMLRFPDGSIEYVPADLATGAQVGAPVTETAAETLVAGREVGSDDILPGPPPLAEAPLSAEALAARVAELEGTNPVRSTDPEQLADTTTFESFLDQLPDALQYLDLAKLTQAPRYRLDPPGILRPRGGGGARALQRLGIASLV